jgi:pimeloyl-ACP methyl ester carboxylesterase
MVALTVATVEVDELTLGYREAGQGDAVLLLHGWPTSSFLYREVMKPIARTHRAIALDMPGFGASSKPVDARYGFAYFANAIDGFLDALGIESIGLVGHDLGGPIAVDYVLRRPERVSRLAILNTLLYPDFDPSVLEFVTTLTTPGKRERATSDEGLEEIMRLGTAGDATVTPEVLDGVTAPFATADDRLALARAGVGLEPERFIEIGKALRDIEIPVRVIYGEQDPILPDVADTLRRVGEDIPHARITGLPEAGHFLQEDAPEEVGELLAEFFSSTDGSGARASSA